ncbi:MAG: hypothetical protein AAB450_01005 [Patescibacteria group bacterium]
MKKLRQKIKEISLIIMVLAILAGTIWMFYRNLVEICKTEGEIRNQSTKTKSVTTNKVNDGKVEVVFQGVMPEMKKPE